MKNQDIIAALQKIIKKDYHFSDYEIQNIAIERQKILIENYKDFIQKLVEKLSHNTKEVDSSIVEYIMKLKPELYFINEFEILILKLNEISYWFFGNSFPLDYYAENKNVLNYLL